jgi:hypothetical protein
MAGNFNTPLAIMGRPTTQNKEVEELTELT